MMILHLSLEQSWALTCSFSRWRCDQVQQRASYIWDPFSNLNSIRTGYHTVYKVVEWLQSIVCQLTPSSLTSCTLTSRLCASSFSLVKSEVFQVRRGSTTGDSLMLCSFIDSLGSPLFCPHLLSPPSATRKARLGKSTWPDLMGKHYTTNNLLFPKRKQANFSKMINVKCYKYTFYRKWSLLQYQWLRFECLCVLVIRRCAGVQYSYFLYFVLHWTRILHLIDYSFNSCSWKTHEGLQLWSCDEFLSLQ